MLIIQQFWAFREKHLKEPKKPINQSTYHLINIIKLYQINNFDKILQLLAKIVPQN
jgi:hypothetical protein